MRLLRAKDGFLMGSKTLVNMAAGLEPVTPLVAFTLCLLLMGGARSRQEGLCSTHNQEAKSCRHTRRAQRPAGRQKAASVPCMDTGGGWGRHVFGVWLWRAAVHSHISCINENYRRILCKLYDHTGLHILPFVTIINEGF